MLGEFALPPPPPFSHPSSLIGISMIKYPIPVYLVAVFQVVYLPYIFVAFRFVLSLCCMSKCIAHWHKSRYTFKAKLLKRQSLYIYIYIHVTSATLKGNEHSYIYTKTTERIAKCTKRRCHLEDVLRQRRTVQYRIKHAFHRCKILLIFVAP